MASNKISLKKIYNFYKEAEPYRKAGLDAPHRRPELAKNIITATSKQNTAVAVAFFIPGADMPILTLNQMKMIIELAALYGQRISAKRAGELLATLGSGYILRSLARELVELIPGPGIFVKAGMAYGGTKALGKLAHKYFEAIAVENKNGS